MKIRKLKKELKKVAVVSVVKHYKDAKCVVAETTTTLYCFDLEKQQVEKQIFTLEGDDLNDLILLSRKQAMLELYES